MPKGTVASFSAVNGYGFITPEKGGRDCFVRKEAVEAAGLGALKPNDRLIYDVLVARNGKVSAVNLIRAATKN